MAGDWIKVECVTPDKPEVYMIAEQLEITPEHAFGCLVCLWIWADQQTIDGGNAKGNAASVTKMLVDRKSGVPGFANAMLETGWLIEGEGGISFPNFDRHNGKTAKNRAVTAKRVAAHKVKSNATGNGDSVTNDEKGNGASVTPALPREEKSNTNTPISPLDSDESKTKPRRSGKPAIGIDRFLADCKADGVKPIPDGDAVFAYADDHEIPRPFLRLCWLEFVERNKANGKRYKDWRASFRNAVRANWYKLWWLEGDTYSLTTTGRQADKKHGVVSTADRDAA